MRASRGNVAFVFGALALAIALVPTQSRAELWCADPLWAHEWGVVVFGASGVSRSSVGPTLPAFFHSQSGAPSAVGGPVRDMAIDGGERELPVLHFYSPSTFRPVPLGLEVGFTHGAASRWYPQVDGLRTATDANGARARAERAQLLAARSRRSPMSALTPLGRDPTRQLAWDHLVLEDTASHTPAPSTTPWVDRLRGFPSALWVNGASESERFVFYEGRTTETTAVVIERGPTFGPGRQHYVLRNRSTHPIHDVLLVHREAGGVYVLHAPQIPAGQTAGFLLEEHRVDASALEAATRGVLRAAMVDGAQPSAPTSYAWGGAGGCVMQRDPAVPFETALDHRVYAQEADAILEIWGARFFDAQGTTVVYREDVAQLDEVMPLSFYTDMYHFVVPHRLGLALMEGVRLP